MAKNGVNSGQVVPVTAGGAITSGEVQEIHGFSGVAGNTVSSGEVYPLYITGRFELGKKTGETWSQFEPLYYDSSAKTCSKTYVAGAADRYIGLAAEDVGTSVATVGDVLLNAGLDLETVVTDADFAGSQVGRLRRTGSGAYDVLADKSDATAAPTVNDDTDLEYGPGSVWVDVTNDNVWVNVDSTADNAIWLEMLPVLVRGQAAFAAATTATASVGTAYNGKVVLTSLLTNDGTSSIVSAAVAAGTLTITASGSMTGKVYYAILKTDVA